MWKEKEVIFIKSNYKKMTNREMGAALERSAISVENKLKNLGLKRDKSWPDYEVKYLEKAYPHIPNGILALKLNKTENAILSKASKLGFRKNPDSIANFRLKLKEDSDIKLSDKYDIICKVCNEFGSDSYRGLSIHLGKKHPEVNNSDYYTEYIGDMTSCHFCGDDGRFIDLNVGYENLCNSEDCVSKSRNVYSIDTHTRKGVSEKDAIDIINKLTDKQVSSRKKTLDEVLKNDPDFNKKRSPNCKEFYIERGYDESSAIDMANSVVEHMQSVSHQMRKDNPLEYAHTYNTKVEYYENKGFDELESLSILSNRQTTFSKDICIEKYGEDLGIEIWQNRQDKWLATLDSKTDEEKKDISLKKIKNSVFYSKISQEIFTHLHKRIDLEIGDRVYYREHNREYFMYDYTNRKYFMYDFVFINSDQTRKKCIEFNGYFWHCKPSLYEANFYNKGKRKTAQEIWDTDEIKNSLIINEGFDLLVIWEDDYKKNKKEVIQQCVNFINS